MIDGRSGTEQEELPAMINELRKYLSITQVKKAFSLGNELIGAASPFLEKPTWWNAGKALFAVGKVMVDDVEVWAEDYFATARWVEPYASDFSPTLVRIMQGFPHEKIKAIEDEAFVRVCTLPGGIKAGWTHLGKDHRADHVYVERDQLHEAKAVIKRLLWEQYSGKSLVMRRNTSFTSHDMSRVTFEVDDAFETKTSKRVSEFANNLKRAFDLGITRSVMLYGPPGTGKSTMARTIVEQLQLRSFRIRIADLSNLESTTLFDAINIFEPDAVILDDFDRARGQDQLLETLEFFEQKVKLVIVTVNNRRMLDMALLRPGRIDVFERVERMDPEVVKHVLGEYVDGHELVKDWPVAFIIEYVKRRRYMGVDEAIESVKELTMRLRELTQDSDPNEDDAGVEQMLRLLRKEAAGRNGTAPGGDDGPFDQGQES